MGTGKLNLKREENNMSSRTEATLAATLREMIAQGWTDSEAHDKKEAFFRRIGNVTDRFTEDQVYEVWGYVYEDVMDEFKMNWEVTARNIINSGLYEAAEALMDDDIREDLNREIAPCAEEDFLVAYMDRHYRRYGAAFVI
jgi:hypothetical protein